MPKKLKKKKIPPNPTQRAVVRELIGAATLGEACRASNCISALLRRPLRDGLTEAEVKYLEETKRQADEVVRRVDLIWRKVKQ